MFNLFEITHYTLPFVLIFNQIFYYVHRITAVNSSLIIVLFGFISVILFKYTMNEIHAEVQIVSKGLKSYTSYFCVFV